MYNKHMTIRMYVLPVMLIAIAALVLTGANSRGLDIDGNGVNYRHRDESSNLLLLHSFRITAVNNEAKRHESNCFELGRFPNILGNYRYRLCALF